MSLKNNRMADLLKDVIGDIRAAKNCNINSVSCRKEMIRLMDEAVSKIENHLEEIVTNSSLNHTDQIEANWKCIKQTLPGHPWKLAEETTYRGFYLLGWESARQHLANKDAMYRKPLPINEEINMAPLLTNEKKEVKA